MTLVSDSDRSPYEQGELASSSPENQARSDHEGDTADSHEEVELEEEQESDKGR